MPHAVTRSRARRAQGHAARLTTSSVAAALLMLVGCHRGAVYSDELNAALQTCAALGNAPASAGEAVSNPLATFDSAWSIVAQSHWDTTFNGVNWRLVRDTLRPKAAEARTVGEVRSVLLAMIGTLGQSHFAIIPAEASDGARESTAGRDNSGDIRATFRIVNGSALLTSVAPGGPAARAGLRAGEEIRAVDGCRVAPRLATLARTLEVRHAKLNGWGFVNGLLSGPPAEIVTVMVADGRGHARRVQVMREASADVVTKFGNLPPMAAHLGWERRLVSGRTIGVIRFNVWMPVLSPRFNRAMDSLRGSDAIVVDVRGNFGGLGTMSTGVAGHFIDSALTLGVMIQRGSTQKLIVNPQRTDGRNRRVLPFAGPVAIVVDELSISTSEIFAAGMQALGRARVFGAQTAGQALPSVAERLPDGDILYHAIANLLSPTGTPVEGGGVHPDVAIPLSRGSLLAGHDAALEAALAWAASAPKRGSGSPN
jgi:carboxyl-terminal processing protease